MTSDKAKLREKTIEDFGQQWIRFDDVDNGYYGCDILFQDILYPLVSATEVEGRSVADVGSGTGRIVKMLLAAGAGTVLAIEPSNAMTVLQKNVGHFENVKLLQVDGTRIPAEASLDWVFSIGVIHHIPNAEEVMRACWLALKPGGKVAIWLYGREGNELYLGAVSPIRWLAQKCPDVLLAAVSWSTVPLLRLYQHLCGVFSLPMRKYFRNHISRLDSRQLVATVFDQLNPAYAKYYTRTEAMHLLEGAGFQDIQIHHRHGYSWTVLGTRPRHDQPHPG